MDIDNMPAGREMDKLICEKLAGWRWVKNSKHAEGWACNGLCGDNCSTEEGFKKWEEDNKKYNGWVNSATPHYSTDIAAAWEVVESLRQKDMWFSMVYAMTHLATGGNPCMLWQTQFRGKKDGRGHADTEPLAICRAALKAVTG